MDAVPSGLGSLLWGTAASMLLVCLGGGKLGAGRIRAKVLLVMGFLFLDFFFPLFLLPPPR